MTDTEFAGEPSKPAHFLSSFFNNVDHVGIGRQYLPTLSSAYVGAKKVSNGYMYEMTIGERIRQARKAAGLTQAALAEQFNIKRVSVTQWESDVTRPETAKLDQLARLLNTTSDWLVSERGEAPPAIIQPIKSKGFKPEITPGNQLVAGAKTLPLYPAAMGGDGHAIVTFDAVEYLKMPAILEGVKGGYGILVKGDSMEPAYWAGDMALVNPNLPPTRDSDVILYHTPPVEMGESEAIIKRLIGMNDREWSLKQYNPVQSFTEFRKDWPICHRVMGKYNAR